MRTVGVFLIHAGVTLRCLIRLPRMQHPGWVIALLALNAILLILEAWLSRRRAAHPAEAPAFDVDLRPVYLLLQAAIITALLLNRPTQDFFALLFIPISLSAVLFYGKRGFLWIAAFTVALAVPLITSKAGLPLGAVLALNYGGLCFLFGGYAYQVRKAEATRGETQRMLVELQVAHGQLREYASQKEELAAEQERNRLARELHDSVTQTVFSMNLTVQAARLLLERDKGRVAGQLQRLEELAAGALREIQALVSSLRPAPAALEDLPAALRRLAAERRSRDGLAGDGGSGRRPQAARTGGRRSVPDRPGGADQRDQARGHRRGDRPPAPGRRGCVPRGGGSRPRLPTPGRFERARPSRPGRHGGAGARDGLASDRRIAARPWHAHPGRGARSGRRRMSRPRRSSAGYVVGWLLFATASLRALIFYGGKPALPIAIALLAGYALLYAAEPSLSPRLRWFRFVYFPLQTGLVLALTNLRPYLDVTCQLYIALGVQALHAFSRRAAVAWLILFSILLTVTEVVGGRLGGGPRAQPDHVGRRLLRDLL